MLATHCKQLLICLLLGVLAHSLKSQVIYVDSAAAGVGNGSNWANAYPRLELALAATVPGDSVWVANGTYYPTTTTTRTISFMVPDGVVIMGGFAGGETSACQADPDANLTILSGDIGVLGDSTDNSYRVVHMWNLQNNVTLDGFVIRDGVANGPNSPQRLGAGLYADQVNLPTRVFIRNCRFVHNSSLMEGSGVKANNACISFIHCDFENNRGGIGLINNGSALYFNLGLLTMIDCRISNNVGVYGQGGGMIVSNGSLTMEDCIVSNNVILSGTGAGGGMMLSGVTAEIDRCSFNNNQGTNGGGAFIGASHFHIRNCTFMGNNSTHTLSNYGGGGLTVESNPGFRRQNRISNCKFLGNHSNAYGGGLFSYDSQLELQDVLFSGNSAILNGGGAAIINGNWDTNYVSNCTFVQNTTNASGGGGLFDWCTWAPIKVRNCLLTGNLPDQFYDHPSAPYASDIRYCLVSGGYPGIGNFTGNPLLQDPDGPDNVIGSLDDDDRLLPGSDAVNRGSPDTTSLWLPALDLGGAPRIQADTVDIGAYEGADCIHQSTGIYAGPDTTLCASSPLALYADVPTAGIGTWSVLSGCARIDLSHDPHATMAVQGQGPFVLEWRIDLCDTTLADTVTLVVLPPAAPPSVTASGPTQFCDGDNVVLSLPNGFSHYSWSNGATTQQITVNASGSFTATVTNAAGCEAATSAATTVTVNPNPLPPTINPATSQTLCAGQGVILTASPGYAAYLWSTGGTANSMNANGSGSYFVRGRNSFGCWSDTSLHVQVQVNPLPPQPVITALGITPFCPGDSILLSAPAGYSQYNWNNGATTANLTVFATANLSVAVVDSNGCQSPASAIFSVVAHPYYLPQIAVMGNPQFCAGDSVVLHGPSSQQAYFWSTGQSGWSITLHGPDTVSLQVTDANGCPSLLSNAIITDTFPLPMPPTLSAAGDTSICDGQSLSLSTPTGMAAYAWTNGATIQTLTLSDSGSFAVSVQDSNGCWNHSLDTLHLTLLARPAPPVLLLTANDTLCEGDSALITVQGQWLSYQWSPNGNGDSVTVNTSSTFSVMVTDANGCISDPSLPLSITFNPIPQAPTVIVANAPNNAICLGDTATLQATGNFSSYQWDDTIPQSQIQVAHASCHTIMGWDVAGCPSEADSVCIVENPLPARPQLNIDTILCAGTTLLLQAPLGYPEYNWSNGGTAAELNIAESGQYWLSIQDHNGCLSPVSDTANVVFEGAVSALESGIILYPNPNKGQFQIRFPSMSAAHVEMNFYNALGQHLLQQSVELTDCRPLDWPVSLVGLADGPYICMFLSGRERFCKVFWVRK